ncbi:MAG TPA: hypothetical protein VIY86_01345, partial [Pirellulaceae bacterium]
MNPVAEFRPQGTGESQQLFDLIAEELRGVEDRLQAELRSDAPWVDELLRYVASLGGKRLRPALVFLAAKATGTTTPAH